MLLWLSGNSAGTLREGRPALLCLVLGCNLKACKVLCGHWRTHGFSPLDIWVCEMFLPVVSFYSLCTLRAFWVLVGVPSSACVLCGQVTKVLAPAYFHYAVSREPHVRGACLASPYQPPERGIHRRDNDFPSFCFQFLSPTPFMGDHILFRNMPVLRTWTRAGSSYLEQSLNSVPWARQPIKGPGDRRGSDSRQELESPPHSFHQLYQERCVHSERRIRGTGINSRSRTGKPGNMPPFQEA